MDEQISPFSFCHRGMDAPPRLRLAEAEETCLFVHQVYDQIPRSDRENQMFTCSKTYTDIPFAHRQHRHDGHCSLIHGHNWSIRLTFGAKQTDANGFVIDFGRLRFLRDWIEQNLDHACLFNADDPLRKILVQAAPEAYKVYLIPSCSCEGLAEHLFGIFDAMVCENTGGRAYLVEVEIWEDSRNSARYRPDPEPVED